MSMHQFLLPDVGEGLTEADIVAWHVAEGDTVAINDVICEIETAKSVVELPSPFAGVVQALMVAVGDTVEVGTAIIQIGSEPASTASSSADAIGQIDLSNPAASGGGEGESLVGRAKADRGSQRRRRRDPARGTRAEAQSQAQSQAQGQLQGAFAPGGAQPVPAPANVEDPGLDESAAPHRAGVLDEPASQVRGAAHDPQGKVLAKPVVRRVARDLGIDLSAVPATGPHGSVTREDVLAVAGTARSAGPSTDTNADRETRVPVKGVLKVMAAAMTASAFTVPHVTEWVSVDVTESMRMLESLTARPEFAAVRLTPMVVIAKACLLAMRRTPIINSFFDEAAGEVVIRERVNLGVAAATDRGLVVPNIKEAQAMGLVELAGALDALVATARQGRTSVEEMAGGTFTVTNVGVFGIDGGTPIINTGEAAILAVGAVNRRPWVVGSGACEELAIRDVVTLALSFDHRHVDGAAGSRFLADVAQVLRDPSTALLF